MKLVLLVVRWVVGLLFIFSGLIKANDPIGLSYKMQEFFEVWGMHHFNDYTLSVSILMNVFEVVSGIAVIIGWRLKLINWSLLLLIVFFTFLTGYALFSGKIKTCGCFGDCLPLTAAQSFGKDLILLLLILLLICFQKEKTHHHKIFHPIFILGISTIFLFALQWYVLKYLPIVDCLPYKKGNNLLDQMKTPAGAINDSSSILFTYMKDGKAFQFDQANFPENFDSTYVFQSREDIVVRKGNGLQAKILDFGLATASGIDTSSALFATNQYYVLIFAQHMQQASQWKKGIETITELGRQKQIPIYLVTANMGEAMALFPNMTILNCDATVLKTAARVIPTFFIMQGPVILEKKSGHQFNAFCQSLSQLPK